MTYCSKTPSQVGEPIDWAAPPSRHATEPLYRNIHATTPGVTIHDRMHALDIYGHSVAKSVRGGHYAVSRGIAVLLVRWKLRRAGLLAEAAQPMYTFDPVPKKRVVSLRPGCCSSVLADVERLPRAKNEIWYQGYETPRSGRRVTRVVSRAA